MGSVFLSADADLAARQAAEIERIAGEEGQTVLGWRDVPHNPDAIGYVAREGMPKIRQVFIAAGGGAASDVDAFERKLYVIRRMAENAIFSSQSEDDFFYVPSLSSRTIAYVGMLMPHQIDDFYPDLTDEAMDSAMALVHSRYSTNTMPTWSLAHPFRYIAHNGEINTMRGNHNAMFAHVAEVGAVATGFP